MKRSPGQKLINFSADEDFIASIEEGRKAVHESRSLFIRKAIADKLRSLGIDFDDTQVYPPDRARPSRTFSDNDETPPTLVTVQSEDKRDLGAEIEGVEIPESELSLEEKVAAMRERAEKAFGKK